MRTRAAWDRVTHAYFAGDAGPKGRLSCGDDDVGVLSFLPIGAGIDYSKTNFIQRRKGDLHYGRELVEALGNLDPDLVLSGNTPTEAQEFLVSACQTNGIAFVYWCQDFYSIAASQILKKNLPVIAGQSGLNQVLRVNYLS